MAQATIALSHRVGLGKARHTETAELWIQDALERRDVVLVKVPGEHTPPDVLTKPVPEDILVRLLAHLGCRAASAEYRP